MNSQGSSKACLLSAVVFFMMFRWGLCLTGVTGEMFCPPVQTGKVYNMTAEIYNLGNYNLNDADIKASLFHGSTKLFVCNYSSRSCKLVKDNAGSFFAVEIKKFGYDNIQLTVSILSLDFTFMGVYFVQWHLGGHTHGKSCDVKFGAPVNECYPVSPCVNATRCSDLLVGYRCVCSTGFSGKNCKQGDLKLRCESSIHTVRLTTGADNCMEVNNSCSVAGLGSNSRINLTPLFFGNNGSSVLGVTPHIIDNTMFVNVCTTPEVLITTYQIIYSLQSTHSMTLLTMQILVHVQKGNTPPMFTSPRKDGVYIFDVPAGTTLQDVTILPVQKSVTPTCDPSSCIQVIDPDTDSSLGIDSLTLSVEPEYYYSSDESSGMVDDRFSKELSYYWNILEREYYYSSDESSGMVDGRFSNELSYYLNILQTEEDEFTSNRYRNKRTRDTLGYFYRFGRLKPSTSVIYKLTVRDGGHASATATVIFNIIDMNDRQTFNERKKTHTYIVNEPLECSTKTTTDLDRRTQPESQVGAVLCLDIGAEATLRKIDFMITGTNADYFSITDDGRIFLAIAVTAFDPGTLNLTVVATGYSAYSDNDYVIRLPVNINLTAVTCPSQTAQFDLTFPEIPVDSEITLNCTGKHSGQITRRCFLNGRWGPFNYNNCSNEELENINTQIDDWIANNSLSVEEVEEKLKTVADNLITTLNESSSVMPADVKQTLEIFNKVGELTLSTTASLDQETVKTFISTADILFGADDNVWKETQKDNEGGAMMLQAMDSIVTAGLRDEHAIDNVSLVTNHLVIKTAVRTDDIDFSSYEEAGQENSGDVTVQSTASAFLSKKAFSQGAVKYSVVLYRNLTDKLQINPNRQSGVLSGKILNSDILTFVLNVSAEVLVPPLQLTFDVSQTNYSRPTCGYLDTNASAAGVWATAGCTTVNLGDTVQCSCNHLTNFAILMSPSGHEISSADKTALSIMSAVGCGISLFCLVVTVIVYASLWKYVKSDRSVLHVNLSVCLILAYIVFLVGVNRTDSEIGCKVVAALLHYLFLVVFFIMLSEGIEVFKSVSFVFSSDSILGKLIPLSYGVPLIIVAVSLGVTRTDGYGGETSCWLSTTGGLIWAFVGPVLLVIVINFIILIQVLRIMQNTKKLVSQPVQERAKSVVRTICLLSPLLGLTWVFGVLSVNRGTIIFQYLFAIFNSLQGVFIFICYCLMTPKVRDGFKTLRHKHRASSFGSRMVSSSSTGKFTDSRTNSTRLKYSNSITHAHTTTACESSFSEARQEIELHKGPNSDGSNDVNPPVIEDTLSPSDRSASWHDIPLGSTDPPIKESGHQFPLGSTDPPTREGLHQSSLGSTDPPTREGVHQSSLGSTDPPTRDGVHQSSLGSTDPPTRESGHQSSLGSTDPPTREGVHQSSLGSTDPVINSSPQVPTPWDTDPAGTLVVVRF